MRWYVFAVPLFAVPILPFNETYEPLGANLPRTIDSEAIARKRVPRLRQRLCDGYNEERVGYLKWFAAYSRKIDSIAILLQFIKVSDNVISFLCGSAAKFAHLREHSQKSMRSRSVDILEILPHLVRTVTAQDMHLLGWCHVPGDQDPREIVVTGPVLHAFQVGSRIRARNRPINVSQHWNFVIMCACQTTQFVLPNLRESSSFILKSLK